MLHLALPRRSLKQKYSFCAVNVAERPSTHLPWLTFTLKMILVNSITIIVFKFLIG